MKVTKERVLPLLVGAAPVVAVLLLVAFVSAAPHVSAPTGNSSQPSSPAVSVPGASTQPSSSQTGGEASGQPAAQTSSGHPSSPLCLPILGCL